MPGTSLTRRRTAASATVAALSRAACSIVTRLGAQSATSMHAFEHMREPLIPMSRFADVARTVRVERRGLHRLPLGTDDRQRAEREYRGGEFFLMRAAQRQSPSTNTA